MRRVDAAVVDRNANTLTCAVRRPRGGGFHRRHVPLQREERLVPRGYGLIDRAGLLPLDHHIFSGGLNGGPATLIINKGTENEINAGMYATGLKLKKGDKIFYGSSGGGGFGNPLDREPELVLEDVIDEWLSMGAAKKYYGVIIEEIDAEAADYRIDEAATVKLRSKMTRDELRARAESSPQAAANIEQNYAEAEKSYLHALELNKAAVEAHAGLGEIYLRRKMYRESARELVTYIRLRPDAPDKSIVMDDLREIAQILKTENGE